MGQSASASARYRFGTFELDRGAAELLKRGVRIKLQEQPYRILCVLLDSPGKVIGREALCAVLWPEGTFVEFERSLNAAIAKLRQALGDSAENPRFVETVARHGYRFIAPVETIALSERATDVGPQRPPVPERAPAAVDRELTGQQSSNSPPSHKGRWILAAAVATMLVAAGVAVIAQRQSRGNTTSEMMRLTFDSGLTTDPAVSPDGKMLAYATDRYGSGRLHIWVQQFMQDGQAVQLTRGDADEHQPAFSPDGSKVVFRSEGDGGGIYVIPAIGGNPTLLAKGGRDPRFSPDGRWIAYWRATAMAAPFVANAGTVYLVSSTGGPPQPVGSDLTEAGVPAWSDDGKRLIVYGRKDDMPAPVGTWNWYVVPVAGGPATSTGAFGLLHEKGFALGLDAPRITNWHGDELLFFGRLGDSVNVWKIHIDGVSSRVTGDPQRLTSGAGLDAYPSLTADGRLLFAALTSSSDVWTLPADTNGRRAIGSPRRVTETIGPHQFASLSADGRLLAYSSVRYRRPRAWIKNLESGTETPVASSTASAYMGQLSPDGSLLAYGSGDENGTGLIVPVRGGTADQFCTKCASVYDVSPDNKVVLYRKGATIHAFDLVSRRDSLFMQSANCYTYQHKFSRDGRWVTFEALYGTRSRLYVAALRNSVSPAPENEWIPLTGDEGWADKPRWSPDGNSIYFISNRDGFFCLWAQRVAADTKRPTGAPAPIAHFHGVRLSMNNIGAGGAMEISVARDKIAFHLGELTGNLWVTTVSR